MRGRTAIAFDEAALLRAIRNGAGIETAAALVGVTGRTVFRRQRVDPDLAARIADARRDAQRLLKRTQHGTVACYRAGGCRCGACRRANAIYCRANKTTRLRRFQQGQATPTVHGANTYSNWGCRCDVCVTANNEAQRRGYHARKVAS